MTLRCPTLRLERHRGVKMHTADSESKNLLVSSCSSCSDKKKCYWWTQLSWGKALRYIKWGSLSLKRWLRGVILTAESKVITLWSNISCTATECLGELLVGPLQDVMKLSSCTIGLRSVGIQNFLCGSGSHFSSSYGSESGSGSGSKSFY